MKTTYYISLNIKTPGGFETYGSFCLGNEREKAAAIFNQLKGSDDFSEKSILHMDFTEMRDGIPLPVKILHCTIDDIAVNARIITRDIFKNRSLESS
ncbi:hypothetical protein [Mucilaginibacter sp.]|uniref:hypothetical protein n=1 Tax=Mucilaginibacter sp. TaxID=1882438 RepID=UPI002622A9E5|nr:hypothetical protein [Mucilaginibacter sp.]MDB4919679.1 hypothetical protein [Mucilaginibacter sp.]